MSEDTQQKTRIKELVEKYRGMQNIPKEVLDEQKLMRFERESSEGGMIVRIHSIAEWTEAASQARQILWGLTGYFYIRDHLRLERTRDGTDYFEGPEREAAISRAMKMKSVGIPPIFQRDFLVELSKSEDATWRISFPLIDFIVQYGAGVYEGRCAAFAIESLSKGRQRISFRNEMVQPAHPKDVQAFRAYAFTDEQTIDIGLKQELEWYIKSHFHFQEEAECTRVMQLVSSALTHLEAMLRDLDHPVRTYIPWDGTFEMVRHRRWYLAYHPDVRREIVRAAHEVSGEEWTKRRKEILIERVNLGTTPEQAVQAVQTFERSKEEEFFSRMERALHDNDLSSLNEWRTYHSSQKHRLQFIEALEGYVRKTCKQILETNPELLRTIEPAKSQKRLKLPYEANRIPQVIEICLEFKIAAWEKLDTEAFLKRSIAYLYRKVPYVCEQQRRFQGYVIKRHQALTLQQNP